LATAPSYDAATLQRLASKRPTGSALLYDQMSTMGAIAAGVAPADAIAPLTIGRLPVPIPEVIGGGAVRVNGPGEPGGQSETSIAANTDASVIVVGYNDPRGFSTTPVSLSGVARSTDGGVTWAEVPGVPGGIGTLPSVTNGQVFGDPDVKYDVL